MALRTLTLLLALVVLISAEDNPSVIPPSSPKTGVLLSSIKPQKLTVDLAYIKSGQTVLQTADPNVPCNDNAVGSPCLVTASAKDGDSVQISYQVIDGNPVNETATVLLKACYSPYGQVDRPWRAANDLIDKSKACPFTIAKGLNPAAGNFTWKVPNNVPSTTLFVRAFVMCPNPADPNAPKQCAYGDSNNQPQLGSAYGIFQTTKIDTRSSGLIIGVAICTPIGPLFFIAYACYAEYRKKHS